MSNAETVANVAQKNARNALQRIEALESGLVQMAEQFNGVIANLQRGTQQMGVAVDAAVRQLQQQFSQFVAILDAVTDILGTDVVAQKTAEMQKTRIQTESDNNQKQVAALLEQGVLVVAEKVSEQSLVVGREISPDTEEAPGEVIFPGRTQVLYTQIMPDIQKQILDQAVGFNIKTPAGNTFEVTEIYDIVKKEEPKPVLAAVPDPVPEATAEASTETPAPEAVAAPETKES